MPVNTDSWKNLLAKIEDGQHELSSLSADYELATRQAYLAAQQDIAERMDDLITSRGGLAALSPRDRFRLTRDAGLFTTIDRRLAELGVTHTGIVHQAWSGGGGLARKHLGVEMQALVEQLQQHQGKAFALGAAIDYAQLDTAAIELGLGTALNDTQNLTAATRAVIQREVQAGVIAGEGIDKLSRRIAPLGEVGKNRAEMITRWATIKSYNATRQVVYEQAAQQIDGLMKQWLTQADERACEACLAHHGEVVAVPAEFDATLTYGAGAPPAPLGELETPPLHPRCRCTIVAWHESWRAYTSKTPEELQADGRDQARLIGAPGAIAPVAGVQVVDVQARAFAALPAGRILAYSATGPFGATIRIPPGTLGDTRTQLRNAGFRVRAVAGNDELLRIDLPDGIPLPRLIRSSVIKKLDDARLLAIKEGLQKCGILSGL